MTELAQEILGKYFKGKSFKDLTEEEREEFNLIYTSSFSKNRSLNNGSIKSARDCGLENKTVADCIEWDEPNPEVELENEFEIYKDKGGLFQHKKRR
jgi:hypothetical protein